MIRCYRIHGYLLNIMGTAYPDFEKYVISNYLCLHNGKENIRREYLDFHLDNNFLDIKQLFRYNDWFDVIQVHDLNNENYKNSIEIKNLIIEFLEKGHYVLHNVNESYLSHTARYGKPDSNNIVMIYGYDFEKDTFLMLDYNAMGIFGTSEVISGEYLNSLAKVTVTNRINFIKAKQGLTFEFDFERSLKLLDCYVQSKNAYPDHDDYMNNIFGYEGVERSLREMQYTGVNLIRMRAIIEHKDVILSYCK